MVGKRERQIERGRERERKKDRGIESRRKKVRERYTEKERE